MRRAELAALALVLALGSCRAGRVPWPRADGPLPASHAEVHTVNPGYARLKSQVLVRSIDRPTRANLDWAAYHANFMIGDAPPEESTGPAGSARADNPFAGALEGATLTGSVRRTPLTEAERARPLALAPLVEFLASRGPELASGLEEVVSSVRGERWGATAAPHLARQMASELFLHEANGATELWVKVEFQPWFQGFSGLSDEDGDGYPELYGRVRPDLVSADAVKLIREDYAGKPLSPAEVKAWANQLSSYWYPSYNTDLVGAGAAWPDDETEEWIRKELGQATFAAPTVVMRGKPQGKATYNVFIVKGAESVPVASTSAPVTLPTSTPTPRPETVVQAVERELTSAGSWSAWNARLAPFHATVRARLKTTPAKVKALAGSDGFLLYRNALEYVVGGDLEKQPRGKNPLPVIAEFRAALAERGVDFLFVPVPNKVEIFPDKLDPAHKALVGEVVNPFGRKLLLSLGKAGVETIDLWTPFQADRRKDPAAAEPLYQAQDTHYGQRGIELAAQILAERIRQYPWWKELARHGRKYGVKTTSFSRYGDLHSRLAEGQKAAYKPETLPARQVVGPDGALYEDDPASPIVLLGDSFTGVYQLTDCQHAGLSAHLARALGYPIDLVMSYGGGPNVRAKLLRRGADELATKRLVVWMMTARDLHNYWESWEPLAISQKAGGK